MQRDQLIRQSAILLGSYAFSVPLSSLIHEVGHIIAMYSVGITQVTLYINPLTESYASPSVPLPVDQILYLSTSGMIFQFIITSILAAILWRKRSTMTLPLLVNFPFSLLNIGSYLLMGSIVEGSDVVLMAETGLPLSVIKVVGIVTVLTGAYVFARLLPLAGMRKTDSWLSVALPLLLCFGTYAATMFIYGYFSGYGTLIGTLNLMFAPIIAVVFTLLFKITGAEEPAEVSNNLTLKILVLGVFLVVLPLIIF